MIRAENAPSGDKILRLATRGGADILGRSDIGSLEVGKVGDCFMIDTNKLEFSGTLDCPASLPATCGINSPVDKTIVGGKIIFQDGKLAQIDEEKIVHNANTMSNKLREFA